MLVIIHGDLQRDQDRRQARHSQFRTGRGPRPADDQMRRRQPLGHVAEEGGDLGRDLGLEIDLASGFKGVGPGLLLHPESRPDRLGQGRQRPGRGLGQDAGALAAAGDHHMDRLSRRGGDERTVVEGADVRPDRIADQTDPRADALRDLLQIGEGRGDRADVGRQPAICAPQHRVLLVQQSGPPLAQGRQQGRRRGIAAEADHHRRVQPLQRGPGLHHAADDGQAGLRHPEGAAAGGGVERDPLLGRKGVGVLLAAMVGGQNDAPAARRQLT